MSLSELFIVRTSDGDSIGYVTLLSNGVQFQADDDYYTGKLNARESIALAEAILEKYSVEYMMLKGSVRKCPTDSDIHDTIKPMAKDYEDA